MSPTGPLDQCAEDPPSCSSGDFEDEPEIVFCIVLPDSGIQIEVCILVVQVNDFLNDGKLYFFRS